MCKVDLKYQEIINSGLLMNDTIISFIKNIFFNKSFIPLHEPKFMGNEKKYLNECIDTNFVSSVGEFVTRFEKDIKEYTGAKFAVAAVNGTAALHIALKLSGVNPGDEVITQPLTFIATCNAIAYCNAKSVFVDVERKTMTLDPDKLEEFLNQNSIIKNDGFCYNKTTGNIIKACVPMHTFGHPGRIDRIKEICDKYNIVLVEDSAESLGSLYKDKHTGTFGKCGIYSFNGNKTITCGGGGMIVTDDEGLAKRAKHITTTAKIPHQWEFNHDEVGYNYRLTNINAALGCAQLENLEMFIENKRQLAEIYNEFFKKYDEIKFFSEPENCRSNYWLNAVILKDLNARDRFLEVTNSNGVMTRPIWKLMNKLPMFEGCMRGNLEISEWLEERVVNIPSSVRL